MRIEACALETPPSVSANLTCEPAPRPTRVTPGRRSMVFPVRLPERITIRAVISAPMLADQESETPGDRPVPAHPHRGLAVPIAGTIRSSNSDVIFLA